MAAVFLSKGCRLLIIFTSESGGYMGGSWEPIPYAGYAYLGHAAQHNEERMIKKE